MERRIATALLFAALLSVLVACGGSTNSSSAPAASAPTAAPAASAPTAVPAASAPTAAPAPAGSTNAAPGTRTFRIVPEQSEASYQVQEQFLNRNLPNLAVGKTNAVEGELQINLNGKPSGQIMKVTVDLSKLTSDESRRDQRIRRQWLESDKYPLAEFTSTDAQNIPESYTEGQEVSFKLMGDLKIREVTKPVTFDVTGKLVGDTITGTATTQILMADFGVEPPSIAGMLTVQDGVTITLNFTAKEVK